MKILLLYLGGWSPPLALLSTPDFFLVPSTTLLTYSWWAPDILVACAMLSSLATCLHTRIFELALESKIFVSFGIFICQLFKS